MVFNRERIIFSINDAVGIKRKEKEKERKEEKRKKKKILTVTSYNIKN